MYALMYPILYIASIHCYIPLLTATSMSVCSVCIVLWHDHVNGEIKALKKKKKKSHLYLWPIQILIDDFAFDMRHNLDLLVCIIRRDP